MRPFEAAQPQVEPRPVPGPAQSRHRRPASPGDRIGHYEIVSLIGEGGMGAVFRARDLRLERDVALKCPWAELAADRSVRERFLREARASARLSHPHIVPVFEIVEARGLPWVAMELVTGRTLTWMLHDGRPLPLDQILRFGEAIASALECAHSHQILHRDVTPNNVLVRADGWPLLSDFGLAHGLVEEGRLRFATTADPSLTQPGQVLGTVPYMSPEQALGRPLDARSDLFSFGAVLYEMCTGRRAFGSGVTAKVFDAILHEEPDPIRPINPEIPPELEAIVKRALSKDRSDRYVSAGALRSDLATLRRHLDSASVEAPLARKRRVSPTPVLAGLLLVAVGAAGWRWLESTGNRRGFTVGAPLQLTTQEGWERAPAISPDGSVVAYVADTSGKPDLWVVESGGGASLQLTSDAGVEDRPAWFPNSEEIAFVSDRTGTPSIWKIGKLGGPPMLLLADAEDPAISPDGRTIAFVRAAPSGNLWIGVAPLDDLGSTRFLTGENDGERDHRHPAWSRNGRALAYSDGRDLWLVEFPHGPARRLTADRAVDRSPAWSADGDWVVFDSYRGGTLALWRVPATGGTPERLTVGTGPEVEPAVSRLGDRLAYSSFLDDYDIELVSLESGERFRVPGQLDETAPALAPDASALVFTSSGRGTRDHLWLQPLSGLLASQPARPLTQLVGKVNTPAFSPDGRWIAFKREHEGRREVWIVPSRGGPATRVSDGAANDVHPAWAPDGSVLAFVSERAGEAHVWRVKVQEGRPTGPPTQVTFEPGTDLLPAWSWDGGWLAYVHCAKSGCELEVVPTWEGAGSARRLVACARFGRVRWHKPSGDLWFAAAFSGDRPKLYRISLRGGDPAEIEGGFPPEIAPPGEFDLSTDGRSLALTRRETRGDIWILRSTEGTY